MNLYVLNDRKTGEYHTITLSVNDESIKREMATLSCLSHASSPVRRFPADFDVYAVGSFDMKAASIVPEKRFICNLKDCIPSEID